MSEAISQGVSIFSPDKRFRTVLRTMQQVSPARIYPLSKLLYGDLSDVKSIIFIIVSQDFTLSPDQLESILTIAERKHVYFLPQVFEATINAAFLNALINYDLNYQRLSEIPAPSFNSDGELENDVPIVQIICSNQYRFPLSQQVKRFVPMNIIFEFVQVSDVQPGCMHIQLDEAGDDDFSSKVLEHIKSQPDVYIRFNESFNDIWTAIGQTLYLQGASDYITGRYNILAINDINDHESNT